MNKLCKKYIREVMAVFPVKTSKEKAYIRRLSADVESYCEEANVTNKQQLYDSYGEPLQVVNGYLSALDTEYVIKRAKTATYIRRAVAAILVLTSVATSLLAIAIYDACQDIPEDEDCYIEEVLNGKTVCIKRIIDGKVVFEYYE